MDRADPIIRRMAERAVLLGQNASELIDQVKATPAPRYSLSERWLTFECGCTAELCGTLYGAERYDPVIFTGLPEQAVYSHVCEFHAPKMAEFVGFGGFRDFGQWAKVRRGRLMGKVA